MPLYQCQRLKAMKNKSVLILIFLYIFSNDSNGQSKIIEKSLIYYLEKNKIYFQHDTLLIQHDTKLLLGYIPKKVNNMLLFSFDKMSPTYFKNATFVLGVGTVKKDDWAKVTLTERDVEYNIESKSWVISYHGEWIFYFKKKGNKYTYRKYTHSSI